MPTAAIPSGARRRPIWRWRWFSLAAATVAGIRSASSAIAAMRGARPCAQRAERHSRPPSIALFGLLIAPLAWVAANIPGASAVGISGIGAAPAMVALFAIRCCRWWPTPWSASMALRPPPMTPPRAWACTDWQRLVTVEFPLAFPVILTGIRIVLVQNIGLATIAALIGGGGFGVFVFQGVGQTAMDWVLLGAVPTVALAFAAAVVLDAVVEMVSPKDSRRDWDRSPHQGTISS